MKTKLTAAVCAVLITAANISASPMPKIAHPVEPHYRTIINIGLTEQLLTDEYLAELEAAERAAEFAEIMDAYKDEIFCLAQMLNGECYPFNETDQRNAAITVCNRCDVSECTISDIIANTCFVGWSRDKVPCETNLRIAREVVEDWLLIKSGEARPWANWLAFRAGSGYSNVYFERWI